MNKVLYVIGRMLRMVARVLLGCFCHCYSTQCCVVAMALLGCYYEKGFI